MIARGLDAEAARTRIEDLTRRVKRNAGPIGCGFSVGISVLEPGGQPDVALQVADQNIYKAKNRVR